MYKVMLQALAMVALAQTQPLQLTDASYESWRAKLAPTSRELVFETLPWESSLTAARRKSIRERKPLIVWVERGHPLGTTSSHGVVLRTQVFTSDRVRSNLGRSVLVAESIPPKPRTPGETEFWSSVFPKLAATKPFEGLVIVAPDGSVVDRIASTDPAEIADRLARLQTMSFAAPGANAARDWLEEPPRPPAPAMRLVAVVRDLSTPTTSIDWHKKAVNTLAFDLTAADLDAFAPKTAIDGTATVWPTALLQRSAATLWLDAVRGVPLSFSIDAIQVGRFVSTVSSADSDSVRWRIAGTLTRSASGEWSLDADDGSLAPSDQNRGIELQVLGRARYDRRAQTWTQFEMLAVGSRWGGGPLNGRKDDTKPGGIGFYVAMDTTPFALLAPPFGQAPER